MHAAWPAKRDSLFSSCSNLVAVFACESTDEKTDEHLKSRRRAEQMRITDSVAMAAAANAHLGRTGSGRVPADFEGEEESCERERRDRRTDGRPRCRQQREGVVRGKMLTGTW